MTKRELVNTLKISNLTCQEAIKKAAEKFPEINDLFYNGALYYNTEFTLEQVKEIYRILGRNELEFILLEENWEDRLPADMYTINGTNKFLEEYKKNDRIKCCNTCEYLRGNAVNSKMPRPYCSLYKKLLASMDANVYEDWCSSYKYIKLDKPRQWFKPSAPANLNMYGDTNTVNGIEKDKIRARKPNEPVRLLDHIGFD